MTNTASSILVTGATGQLGRLVIDALLKRIPASRIVAGVRSPEKASDISALGVAVRAFDYEDPDALAAALEGIDRLLLISSNAIGQRAAHHQAVIDAAAKAGVGLIVYTSLLGGDRSPLPLRAEHVETEAALKASGVPHAVLRNGWYLENHLGNIPAALEHGVVMGSAGNGRFSAAARADFAEAAAVVLTSTEEQAGKVYELAGDDSFTMDEWAATLARIAGKPVVYKDMPEADYNAFLQSVGLPAPVADLLAGSDAGAAKGGLHDDGRTLSKLIGRPTTSLEAVLTSALSG